MCQTNNNNNLKITHNYTCHTQMRAKKGIKMFGDEATKAIENEYEQMDKLNIFQPLHFQNILNKKK